MQIAALSTEKMSLFSMIHFKIPHLVLPTFAAHLSGVHILAENNKNNC